jgi:ATP-dependent Clp protease protease subunit
MTKRNIPAAPSIRPRAGIQCDLSPKALEMWDSSLVAAVDGEEADNVITIYEPIGYDWWTGEGATAKRIANALRYIGANEDVVVNINSPGGDVFEGLAIYNLLREHKGKVTVNILGLAASAASFIAMAGDEVRIGRAAFLMIHNGWVVAAGNRNDFREIADWLEPFDKTIADIYSVRTGIDIEELMSQMDSEKWIGGKDAVDLGWADDLLASDSIKKSASNRNEKTIAARRLDAAMARSGIPRSERKSMMNNFKDSMRDATDLGMPSATKTDMPCAVHLAEGLKEQSALSASLLDILPKR